MCCRLLLVFLFLSLLILLCSVAFLFWVSLSERHRLEFLGVTSLITEESRVIAFASFGITAERDATVIRDLALLRFIGVFRSFPSFLLVQQRVLDVNL
jgi:hypothetical protein